MIGPAYLGTREARVLEVPGMVNLKNGGNGDRDTRGKKQADEAVRRAVRSRDPLADTGNGGPSRNAKLPRFFPATSTRQRNPPELSKSPESPIREGRGTREAFRLPLDKTASRKPPPAATIDYDISSDTDSAIDIGVQEYDTPPSAYSSSPPEPISSRLPQPRKSHLHSAIKSGSNGNSDDPIIVYHSKAVQPLPTNDENQPIVIARRTSTAASAKNKGKGVKIGSNSQDGTKFLMSGAIGKNKSAKTEAKVYERPSVEDEENESE